MLKGKQMAGKKVVGYLKKEERAVEKKFHLFLDAWKQHIREEIAVHKQMLSGKRSLKQHVGDTARIHEEFLRKIKKI